MKHGANCNCMMCAVGKKLGMIRDKKHDHGGNNGNNGNKCEHCGHTHKADGRCDCGCK